MVVRLEGKPFNLTLVQVYAPTNQASEGDKAQFYEQLQDVIDQAPQGDSVLISGDLNAKLGAGSPVGRFVLGEAKDNGKRLTQFCLSNAYVAANAMVERHPRRKATWKSPDGATRNQIDFVLVPTRWVWSVSGCRTYPGADIIQTDHSLVAGTLHLKLRSRPPQSAQLGWS